MATIYGYLLVKPLVSNLFHTNICVDKNNWHNDVATWEPIFVVLRFSFVCFYSLEGKGEIGKTNDAMLLWVLICHRFRVWFRSSKINNKTKNIAEHSMMVGVILYGFYMDLVVILLQWFLNLFSRICLYYRQAWYELGKSSDFCILVEIKVELY